jgi:hypothetical protein
MLGLGRSETDDAAKDWEGLVSTEGVSKRLATLLLAQNTAI